MEIIDVESRWVPPSESHIGLAVSYNPLQPAVTRYFEPGCTLAELLETEGVTGTGWLVTVGGVEVEKQYWSLVRVKHGHLIEAKSVVRKQVLAIAAIAAISYFTLGLGGYAAAGTFLGVSGTAGFALAAGVMMAGTLLVNKLLAPKIPPADSGSTEVAKSYGLSGGQNNARLYQPLAMVFGETKMVPDLASKQFTFFQGDDQFLQAVFHAGVNTASIRALQIGDTDAGLYQEVSTIQQGFATPDTGTIPVTNVDTIAGALLDNPGTPVITTRTTSDATVSIGVDIEAQITSINNSGKYEAATAQFYFHYRRVGDSAWTPFADGVFTITNSDGKPARRTYRIDVPAGKYELQGWKVTPNASTTQKSNTITWAALKSYQADTADYAGQPRLWMQVKATGQLNGSLDTVNFIARGRTFPLWNGFGWDSPTEPGANGVSNPGGIILQLLRGIRRESDGRLIAGLGLADRFIDIPSLQRFMMRCRAKGFRFDACIQESMSILDLIDTIADCGFGRLTRQSGKYGITYLAEDDPVVGLINMATMVSQSFSIEEDFTPVADELEYQFYDAENGWVQNPVRVTSPILVGTPQRTASIPVVGTSYGEQAARRARLTLGQALYARQSIKFSMDLEGLLYPRGSVVALSHDLTQWGAGGQLRRFQRDGANTIVTLDEPYPEVTGALMLGLRLPGEMQMRVMPVAALSADRRVVTLGYAWPAGLAVPGVDFPAHDTLWVGDAKATPGYRARVTNVEFDDSETATMTCVPESDELWDFVWNGTWKQPASGSIAVVRPPSVTDVQVTAERIRVGEAFRTQLTAIFNVQGNYDHALLFGSADGAPQQLIGSSIFGTRVTWDADIGTNWSITIRAFDTLGRSGTPGTANFIIASDVVKTVEQLALAVDNNGIRATWAAPEGLAAVDWSLTELRVGDTFETAATVYSGRGTNVLLGWVAAGELRVWASHKNTVGDWSPAQTATLLVRAPLQPNVSITRMQSEATTTWSDSRTTQPLKAYRVRVGATYESAVLVWEGLTLQWKTQYTTAGTRKHWVTAIDQGNNESAPGSATIETLPSIEDAIAQLHDGLDEVGEDINGNAAAIAAQQVALANEVATRGQQIAEETAARVQAIANEVSARTDAITAAAQAEADLRVQAIQAEALARTQALAKEASDRAAAIIDETNARNAALAAEAATRAQALTDEALARTNAITSAVAKEATDRANAITKEASDRADAIYQEAQARAQALLDEAEARDSAVASESNARVEGDAAIGRRVDTVVSQANTDRGNYTSLVQTEAQTRADSDGALGRRIDTVSASGDTNLGKALAAVQTEADARVGADGVLGSRIDTTVARIADAEGNILGQATEISNVKTRVSATETGLETQAGRTTALVSQVNQVRNYRLVAAGNGSPAAIINGRGIFNQQGDRLWTTQRSWTTFGLTPAGEILNPTTWDVYAGAAPDLAAVLAAQPYGQFTGFITFDEPYSNSQNPALRAQLLDYGATLGNLDAIKFRGAYILLGYKGAGAGQGIESISPFGNNDDGETRNWVETQLQVVNGKPVGLNGAVKGLSATVAGVASVASDAQTRVATVEGRVVVEAARTDTVVAQANTDRANATAAVNSEAKTRADADSAQASRIDTVQAAFQQNGANRTTNGDMEIVDPVFWVGPNTSIAKGIEIYNNAQVACSPQIVPGRDNFGKAQRITFTELANSQMGILATEGFNPDWVPGQTYVFSFYHRRQAGYPGTGCYLGWNKQPAESTFLLNPPATEQWQRYAIRLKMGTVVEPSGGFYLSIDTYPIGGWKGWMEFADLMISEGPALLPYSPPSKGAVIARTTAMAAVTSEASTRATADGALGGRIDTVVSQANTDRGNSVALVQEEALARTTADSALATRADAITARLNQDSANFCWNPRFSLGNAGWVQQPEPVAGSPTPLVMRHYGRDMYFGDLVEVNEGEIHYFEVMAAPVDLGDIPFGIGIRVTDVNDQNPNWVRVTTSLGHEVNPETGTTWRRAFGTFKIPHGVRYALLWVQVDRGLPANPTQDWYFTNVVWRAAGVLTSAFASITAEAKASVDRDNVLTETTNAQTSRLNSLDGTVAGQATDITNIKTRVSATETGLVTEANRTTALTTQVNRTANYLLVAAGAGSARSGQSGVYTADGQRPLVAGRSWNTFGVGTANNIYGWTTWDVFATGGTPLADAIRGNPYGTFTAFITDDEPSGGLSADLREQLLDYGATKGNLDNIRYRGAYILIGYKGAGEGGGIELLSQYVLGDGTDNRAWVQYSLQLVNGWPVGLNGSARGLTAVAAGIATVASDAQTRVGVVEDRVTVEAARTDSVISQANTDRGNYQGLVSQEAATRASEDAAAATRVDIVAARLATKGKALNSDPFFTDPTQWFPADAYAPIAQFVGPEVISLSDSGKTAVAASTSRSILARTTVAVSQGKRYRLSWAVYKEPNQKGSLYIRMYPTDIYGSANGPEIQSLIEAKFYPNNQWIKDSADWVCPANIYYVRPFALLAWGADGQDGHRMYLQNFRIEEITGEYEIAASVTTEASTRATADGALSIRVDGVVSQANTDRSNATAAVSTEAKTRADADIAQASRTDTIQSAFEQGGYNRTTNGDMQMVAAPGVQGSVTYGVLPYNNGGLPVVESRVDGRNGGIAHRVEYKDNAAGTGNKSSNQGFYFERFFQPVWEPNKTYVVSFYMRRQAGTAGIGRLTSSAWNVPPVAETFLLNPPITDQFQRYARRIVWGANVEANGRWFIDTSPAGYDRLGWLDLCDVMVSEGTALLPYSPPALGAPRAQAAITSEASTRATADGALSIRVDGVVSQANTDRSNASSAVNAEALARANADSAMASNITSISARFSGLGKALNSDPFFLDPLQWDEGAHGSFAAFGSFNDGEFTYAYSRVGGSLQSKGVQVIPGRRYRISAYLINEPGARTAYLRLVNLNGQYNVQIIPGLENFTPPTGDYQLFSYDWVCTQGVNRVAIRAILNWPPAADTPGQFIRNFRIEEVTGEFDTNALIQTEQVTRANADSAMASDILAIKASSGASANLYPDAELAGDLSGWYRVDGLDFIVEVARNLAGSFWQPYGRNNIGFRVLGGMGQQDLFALYGPAIPVVPLTKYILSYYSAAHRSRAQIYVGLYDANLTFLGALPGPTAEAGKEGGQNLNAWQRLTQVFDTLASCAYVRPIMATHRTAGQDNLYMWMTMPMLEQAKPGQTEASPWAPGGAGSMAAIVSEATARAGADGALTLRIDTLKADTDTDRGNFSTLISNETTARTNADGALGGRVDSVISQANTDRSNASSAVGSEAATRAAADSALTTRSDYLQARLNVDLTNLCYNPKFEKDAEGWAGVVRWVGGAPAVEPGPFFGRAQGRDHTFGPVRPVQEGEVHYMEMQAANFGGSFTCALGLMIYSKDGTFLNWIGVVGFNPNEGWKRKTGYYTIPKDVGFANIWVQINRGAPFNAGEDWAIGNVVWRAAGMVGPIQADIVNNAKASVDRDQALTDVQNSQNTRLVNAETGISGNSTAIGQITTRVQNVEGGIATQAVRTDTLVSQVGTTRNYMIVATGGGSSQDANRGVYTPDGNRIFVTGRSWNTFGINADGQLYGFTTWDVFGGQGEALSNAIAGNAYGVLTVFVTSDEPTQGMTPNLRYNLLQYGATAATLDSLRYRGAYILIGYQGAGEGGGIELISPFNNTDNGENRNWLNYRLQIVNGWPVGLTGAKGAVKAAAASASIATDAQTRVSSVEGVVAGQATSIQNLNTTVGQNTVNISTAQSTAATALGKVNASYTVSLSTDAGGRQIATGFTLQNDGSQTEFMIQAQRFSISAGGAANSVKYPFVVGTVDGQTTVGIDGTLVVDGGILARSLNIGNGVNIYPNSALTNGYQNLEYEASIPGNYIASGINLNSDWMLAGGANVQWFRQDGTYGQNDDNYFIAHRTGPINVTPGKRYEFSSYHGAHRCKTSLYIAFFDVNGNALLYTPQQFNTSVQGGRTKEEYQRLGGFATAPANAAYARMYQRKYATYPGNSDSYMFYAMPLFAEAYPNQTVLSSWTDGSLGTQITPQGISTPDLSSISATIGYLRTRASGGRLELNSEFMRIYADNNVLTVEIGELT